MTEQLFARLTDGRPAPLTAPAGVTRYTYDPRDPTPSTGGATGCG